MFGNSPDPAVDAQLLGNLAVADTLLNPQASVILGFWSMSIVCARKRGRYFLENTENSNLTETTENILEACETAMSGL